MPALTSAILAASAVASAGMAAYGLYEKSQGTDQQVGGARQQADISGAQARLSASTNIAQQGINQQQAGLSAYGASQSAAINRQIVSGEQALETQRLVAMEVTSRRSQLQVIRNQQVARAHALATATAQGGRQGSALQGAYGQISGEAGTNMVGIQQSLDTGRNMFGINAGIADQKISAQNLTDYLAQAQAGLTSQNTSLLSGYYANNAALTTAYSAAGGDIAAGAGRAAFGSSLLSASPSIFSLGQVGAKFATPSQAGPSSGPIYQPNYVAGNPGQYGTLY